MSSFFKSKQSNSVLETDDTPKPSKKLNQLLKNGRYLSNSSKKRHKTDLNIFGEGYNSRMGKIKDRSVDAHSIKVDKKPKSHEQ